MKPIIACFLYFILGITITVAQNLSFTSFYDEADTYVRHHSPTESLDYIDKLQLQYTDKTSQQTLKTAKLFPLIQADMYDATLLISKELLQDPELPQNYRIVAYLRRALVYEILEINDKSKLELDRASELVSQPNYLKSELRAEMLYRYGSLYRVEKKDSLANVYTDRSIAMSIENNHSDALAVASMLKGFLTLDVNYDTKVHYFNEALQNYKAHDDALGVSSMFYNLGKLNLRNGHCKIALELADSTIKYSKPYPYHFAYSRAYQLKGGIYKQQHMADSALVNLEKFHKLDTKLSEDKQALKIRELEYNFLLEQERINKNQVEKDNDEMKGFNSKLMLLIYGLVSFLVALIFLTFLIYRSNNTIKRNKSEISVKNQNLENNIQEKELLLKELNHRVKNNLSLILSLINFQGNEIEDEFYKAKFTTLQHRIEAIAIVHEQMMHSTDENQLEDRQNIHDYIHKIAHSLMSLDARTITFNADIPNIYVSLDVAVPIGILVNELISNSIKHAVTDGTLILCIDISEQDNKLHIRFSDNGSHFNSNGNTESLGLLIMQSMVTQLKGTFHRKDSTFDIQIQKNRQLDA